ncbi:hypothetical protein NDI76_00910 [Halogeometricum sp. S1BR25-6]|uniref:DUF7130 domain-containing protein n=1 Tax=Halogeometricum salsisoli TaxID=2950536 RepID=A0ABU2G911_9EURY|nr:hypothetical protein [Halogeometricum sp. S1BR25-6]MDS0297301.1 hypothetical protein [Halogeometricum sp. S1BR25-6]
MTDEKPSVSIGRTVYTENGEKLGTVRGFDDDGFYVSTREGIVSLSVEHERAGHEFGEAELMWRCGTCGEMGDVEQMPDSCPNCGAEKEELYYWTED